MKAACVLLCLALGASANIFKRQRQNLIEQPQEYINQYQRPLYRPREQTYQEYIRAQKQVQSSSEETREIQDAYQGLNTPLYSAAVMSVQDAIPRGYPPSKREWTMPINVPELGIWRGQLPVDSPVAQEIQSIVTQAKQAMKPMTAEDKTSFQSLAAQKDDENAHLNATELLKKYQYPVEEHTVKTDDGYFLTLFRIPAKKQQIRDVTAKPVVFLMHGLLGSADDWLLMGPGKSLAYLLADAGYDVWLGNARGNKYSRRHVTKHAALDDFWQFSTDEVALHDLPAMIDYALKTSGQEKLHYVGHAFGSTAFFALAAARPAYNEKIISMHALSPMVYMSHVRSPLIRMSAPTGSFWARLQRLIGRGAFEPTKELIASAGGDMLATEIGNNIVSSNVNFVMSGVIDNAEQVPVVGAHLPAGGSSRTIKQYGQAVASGEFMKYDFGPAINSQVYGTVVPSKYNMSKVTAPVTLYSAADDWLSHPTDVARLQSELPHSETYEVPEPHFSHMDFQFSTKAPEIVYKKLIESMNRPY